MIKAQLTLKQKYQTTNRSKIYIPKFAILTILRFGNTNKLGRFEFTRGAIKILKNEKQ